MQNSKVLWAVLAAIGALLVANLVFMRQTGRRLDQIESSTLATAAVTSPASVVQPVSPKASAAATEEPAEPGGAVLSYDSFDAIWRKAGMIERAERECWSKDEPTAQFVHFRVGVGPDGKASSVEVDRHRDMDAVAPLATCLGKLIRELRLPPSEPVRVQVNRR